MHQYTSSNDKTLGAKLSSKQYAHTPKSIQGVAISKIEQIQDHSMSQLISQNSPTWTEEKDKEEHEHE